MSEGHNGEHSKVGVMDDAVPTGNLWAITLLTFLFVGIAVFGLRKGYETMVDETIYAQKLATPRLPSRGGSGARCETSEGRGGRRTQASNEHHRSGKAGRRQPVPSCANAPGIHSAKLLRQEDNNLVTTLRVLQEPALLAVACTLLGSDLRKRGCNRPWLRRWAWRKSPETRYPGMLS